MKAINLAAAVAAISALMATTALAAACQPITNFGADGTSLGNVLTCTTGSSDTATITGPGSGFTVHVAAVGFSGEFALGTPFLLDNDVSGPVTVTFSAPMTTLDDVAIEAAASGTYTATADLYLGGELVGTDTYTSVTAAAPGTIPSFNDTVPGGFDKIVFSTTHDTDGLAFGFVSSSVAEPAAWTMMLGGVFGLGGMMRFRRGKLAAAI